MCDRGRYKSEAGNSLCDQCPSDAFTVEPGAASLYECVCNKAYYNTEEDGMTCAPCPIGTSCKEEERPSGGGIDIRSLPVQPGFYRLGDTSVDVRRCPDAGAGCTNAQSCEKSPHTEQIAAVEPLGSRQVWSTQARRYSAEFTPAGARGARRCLVGPLRLLSDLRHQRTSPLWGG